MLEVYTGLLAKDALNTGMKLKMKLRTLCPFQFFEEKTERLFVCLVNYPRPLNVNIGLPKSRLNPSMLIHSNIIVINSFNVFFLCCIPLPNYLKSPLMLI